MKEKNVLGEKQELSNDVKHLMNSDLTLSYDTEAKNLFANKEILSVIAKNVVTEVKDYSYKDIAAMIGNVSISKDTVSINGAIEKLDSESNYLKEKTIHYDIKTTISGEIELIINLEIQRGTKEYVLEMRGSYYISRMFSEQLKDISKEAHYTKLKKVYSIWIVVDETEEERIERYSLMNMDTLQINPKNDPFCLVMIYLGKELPKNALVKYIKSLLERDIDYLRNYYVIDDEIERSMMKMCNLGEGIREDALAEGLEKGRTEGKTEERVEIVLNMLKEGLDVDVISKLTGISLEEVKRICNR